MGGAGGGVGLGGEGGELLQNHWGTADVGWLGSSALSGPRAFSTCSILPRPFRNTANGPKKNFSNEVGATIADFTVTVLSRK